jgi:hypothetical protein
MTKGREFFADRPGRCRNLSRSGRTGERLCFPCRRALRFAVGLPEAPGLLAYRPTFCATPERRGGVSDRFPVPPNISCRSDQLQRWAQSAKWGILCARRPGLSLLSSYYRPVGLPDDGGADECSSSYGGEAHRGGTGPSASFRLDHPQSDRAVGQGSPAGPLSPLSPGTPQELRLPAVGAPFTFRSL